VSVARLRRAGLPRQSPAREPGQRRRRRRLDLRTAYFGNAAWVQRAGAVFCRVPGVGQLEQVHTVVVSDRWRVVAAEGVEDADGVGLVHQVWDLAVGRPAER
jgi:hypothetical protein